MKIGKIKRCQGFEKLGRRAEATCNPPELFFGNCVSITIVLFRNKIWLCEKIQTFYCCFDNYPLSEVGLAQ